MAARAGAVKEHVPAGSLLLAVHDFVARSTDELSLAKGDRIELVERDDDFGDGWFLGRHMANGKTGLFPEVYTTPAPKGMAANAPQRRRSDGPPKTPQDGNATGMTGSLQHLPTTNAQRPASASSSQPNAASPMALRTSTSSLGTPTMKNLNSMSVDSPVMNETLSVIDEHMNDMNVPRMPFTNGASSNTGSTSAAPQPLARFSYIAGHETDEEEHETHTEEEVMAWSPGRVAEYLEDHGVERAHCEVFKEQEISGEVLLAMEQSSIFLKEFDLGPVGRRLKTWHKVRALQDEVRIGGPAKVARSNSEYSNVGDETSNDTTRNRASTMGSILPRALDPAARQSIAAPQRSSTLQSMSSNSGGTQAPNRTDGMSPLQSMTSFSRPENTYRPSAQIIREMQHSRRHSSIDSTSASVDGGTRHRKQPSLDTKWQLGQPQTNGTSAGHSHTLSADTAAPKRQSSFLTTTPDDLDRGYFSSTDADSRSGKKNVLTKRNPPAAPSTHSRQSSSATQSKRRSLNIRSGSMGASSPATGSFYGSTSGVFGGLSSVGNTYDSMRSVTAPTPQAKQTRTAQEALSPVVTKLDYGDQSLDSSMSQAMRNDSANKSSSSPSSNKFAFFSSNKPKITGLRTISDAITRNEKITASPTKEGAPFSSRTGSTTPSTETQSLELQKSEAQSRTSNGSATNLVPPPARQKRMKPKTKKSTSAYTRGLEKKTPAEQMSSCDYSGWMKKKSGSLMTTWKPRLFILKGRRLSYYYSDTDTEEKGLIDISFHRVLPAHNETLTGLHATMTGVATPTSPKDSTASTTSQQDLKHHPPPAGDEGIFIFKLVPPKSGLSKGVNFTRPTVHYFAVNSRQEGRLWMAALMKATIDRDDEGMVTTTYNQKTISLAKARARRERPPALREEDDLDESAELEGDDEASGRGLGIGGLDEKNDALPGAEEESSYAPSTVGGGEGSSPHWNEKEVVS
ncbi:polar growth protein [Saxophila tyrrhenica]|uniref:Polar growth protein n=1 Tax=Saxophila tyrrhenica TaxID=1690608 RepID=A0AAV9PCV5_9PEZI|nr:polar growth protein [Saxophila tyrrhenica]